MPRSGKGNIPVIVAANGRVSTSSTKRRVPCVSRKKREPKPNPSVDLGPRDLQTTPGPETGDSVLVVGVGASAGGLEAFSKLLEGLPAAPGFAVVLIQHLQPTHKSDLAQILGWKTPMTVVQAEDGMRIEADHVYAIPPNVVMRLAGDTFSLSPRPSTTIPSLPVDLFLTSLAEQYGSRAIGVILSGSASDGTKGMAAIKAADGITIVQDPMTAAHTGMPESAIAAGVADIVLPIDEIARELVRLAEHPYVRRAEQAEAAEATPLSADDESALAEILEMVRAAAGLDLCHYKRPTLLRRIERRVAARRVAGLVAYASLLAEDPGEVRELLSDILVRVTSFFRDPEVFEALKTAVFPAILERRSDDGPIRIWIPGCATGQEAYSVGITLLEHLRNSGSRAEVKIFASDLREGDLALARRGWFPPGIKAEVGEDRLANFFTEADGGYQINESLREMCLFARHDVTRDPPFARLDLVSCRNLLIYLDGTLQRRLLSVFHYALASDGFLILGDSESTGAAPDLFERTEHKAVFARLPGETRQFAFDGATRDATQPAADPNAGPWVEPDREHEWNDAQRQLDAMLLDRFAPAAILVDARQQVRQIRGNAGDYLRFRPGDASLSLSGMVSVGLESAIHSAIDEARETGRPTRRETVRPRSGGGHEALEIVVIPVVASAELPPSYAVLFNDGATVSRGEGELGAEPSETEYLRQELEAATERLRILRNGRDAAHESLRAANEEIQSSNEELRSMNEELDTSKEELQSTNEELTTLNDEIQGRNAQLTRLNDDLNNLLISASIAMLVLDDDLTIRHFTEQAARIFNLIVGDIGRRITDIRWPLISGDVEDLVESVMQSGQSTEQEVADDSDYWFRMTIRPYQTSEGRTRGVVIALLDIDTLHHTQVALERAALLSDAVNRVGAALYPIEGRAPSPHKALEVVRDVLHANRARLVSWSDGDWTLTTESPGTDSAQEPRLLSAEEAEQLELRIITEPGPFVEPSADRFSRQTVPLFSSRGDFLGLLRLDFKDERSSLDATENDFTIRMATSIAIFLERERQAEILERLVKERTAALEEALLSLESASHVKNMFLANMSHELRTPLNSIIGFSTVLLDGMAGDLNEEQHRQLAMVLNSGKHLLAIISDLLDLEKITAGVMPMTVKEFRLSDLVSSIGELMMPLAESKGIELALPAADSSIVLLSDELKVRQVLLNPISNAIKFTDAGRVTVDATTARETCTITVEDTGHGMTPEQLKDAFKEFVQVENDPNHLTEGTGLGLSIAARLAHMLGGSLSAESTRGVGSTFTLTLALRILPTD